MLGDEISNELNNAREDGKDYSNSVRLSREEIEALLEVSKVSSNLSERKAFARRSKIHRDLPVQQYNFKFEWVLTPQQRHALHDYHERYARIASKELSLMLQVPVEVRLEQTADGYISEFWRLKPPEDPVAIFTGTPWLHGEHMLSCSFKWVLACIDRLLGGPGTPPSEIRQMTQLEQALLQRLFMRLLKSYESAMSSIRGDSLTVNLTNVLTGANAAPIEPVSEGAFIARFRVSMRNEIGTMMLCVRMEPIKLMWLGWTKRKHPPAKGETTSSHPVLHVPVQIAALIGTGKIKVSELATIQIGDIIVLDSFLNETIECAAVSDKRVLFEAMPCVCGGHYAVFVTRATKIGKGGDEDDSGKGSQRG